ncbi:complex I subunit 4 family protein, partial [Wolbachia endosymbiont of Pentidionis agamae]|uniref:complex I subunit 4 family protein n=1 Tax=Wolbachia endosymbiont of Pentidionis agamae TaxID=3110435 RepID=UPI002FD43E4F
FKLFLYTLAGSLLFLLGIVYLYVTFNTFDIQKLIMLAPNLNCTVQILLWLAFFISFAIKVPMFPFHTWLPDAHVQSPTSGSVILAGILIKMGGYGFLRFSLPMLPEASIYFSNVIVFLSIIAVIYTSFIAFAQDDIKKLVAYSSVAHMGIVTAGIFSFNEEGVLGAIFQMISHGFISSALFFCIGILYSRAKTLKIEKYNGIASIMPKFSTLFILFSMAAIGLPGTSGFIGEFLSILGIFKSVKFTAGFIVLGVILSAIYMLNLCKQTVWGIASTNVKYNDVNRMELLILVVFAILIVLFGFYPMSVLNCLKPCVGSLLVKYTAL